ncbi:Cytochrome P450 [Mycena sanguinolenta]|uniref:Cytochrome P450 n=1 Tax=Mycena sanguinolenta TaxID=230812 RepID=A0A8H6ZE53_9AGAR|nr:Cytochrome P450 [Mycena sanguinolenta]
MRTPNVGPAELGFLVASSYIFYVFLARFGSRRSTRLKGPTSGNFLFGNMPQLLNAPDVGAIYEKWAARYGSVFSVPAILGSRTVVLTDPKSITHFAARETYGYVGTPQAKRFLERLIGRGLFVAEGDSHKRRVQITGTFIFACFDLDILSRQRRALNPAFSNAAIKNLTPVFFDSAYKTKAAWDTMIESGPSEGTVIEVQMWMNHISLDTIGLAGFAHDFGTLSGKTSSIAKALDELGSKPSTFLDDVFFLLSSIRPVFASVPTSRRLMLNQLTKEMFAIGEKFLESTGDVTALDKSVIGLLVKSASSEKISQEEVKAQINVLLLAGYETTASKSKFVPNTCITDPIRFKLASRGHSSNSHATQKSKPNSDKSFSSWVEILFGKILPTMAPSSMRSHAKFCVAIHLSRKSNEWQAAEDDILPLSAPLEAANGQVVESVFVREGTVVTLPISCINRSEAFWGPTAKTFNPARWLDETDGIDKHRAQEIQGYRHLLTFSDGARICLGKTFAVVEFKAVLSVLVRNYMFELPGGPKTAIGRHQNILPRPKVEGEGWIWCALEDSTLCVFRIGFLTLSFCS